MNEPSAPETYASWINRSRAFMDIIHPSCATRLYRLLDDEKTARVGDALPEGWQWLYFLPEAMQSNLSEDGHERRGGFYPPIAAPRRMFASGNATYHRRLLLGKSAELVETIESITHREGRSGHLVFMRVGRHISQDGALCVEEQQNIVYRQASPQSAEPPAAGETEQRPAQWRRQVTATPTSLFRFSALTFNAHRIHYDRDYSTREEGYPGLVVHGPLLAMLCLEEARKHAGKRRIRSFSFRAIRALFDIEPFTLCGRIDADEASMWVEAADSTVAFRATAKI